MTGKARPRKKMKKTAAGQDEAEKKVADEHLQKGQEEKNGVKTKTDKPSQ